MRSSGITLTAIGRVRTKASVEDLKKRKRFVVLDIVVERRLVKGLSGIEDYSHLFIIFWLHKRTNNSRRGQLLVHPRHREDLPKVGVFSANGASHPNHIGLTVVKLLKRSSENVLTVKGLDALNGTPILDIKPYDYQDITKEKIRVPKWWLKLHQGRNFSKN